MDQDRLRKIVGALLNDTGRTPQEAKLARNKAAQLMLDAGVSEAELLSEDADMLLETLDIGRREWLVSKFIMTRVARLSGCRSYVMDLRSAAGRRSDRKRVHFAGYRPDVENAEWLMAHLLAAATSAVRQSGMKTNRQKEDMLVAFGGTVARRLDELADAMTVVREEQDFTSGQYLVEVRDAKVDKFMKDDLGLELVMSQHRGRSTGLEASEAGKAAGRAVALGRPVEHGGRPALPSS
jgi:hypothetical protein